MPALAPGGRSSQQLSAAEVTAHTLGTMPGGANCSHEEHARVVTLGNEAARARRAQFDTFTLQGADALLVCAGTCDDKKCVSSSRTGSNKCAGSGIHNEVLSCCEANFKCYKNTDDFSQCRDSTQALPTRFEPTPLPCGTYGASGPGGYYGAKL